MTEVVVVTGYDALAEVYEWLISDAKLTPAEFAGRSELHSLGLRIEKSTFDPEAEGYTVVATKE